ncbi:MAG TPA: XrtA/PEP-CTERM system histidine kinase PrsK [Verrucomicrobiae bacterium]|nr:XrtA/PEP-CTERM system histidine kinase PrsK [Verrucomicrobiae bacterium]
MNLSAILSFAAAAVSSIFALGIGALKWRALAFRGFAVGMLAFAAEQLFAGLAANAGSIEAMGKWQTLSLICTAFLPASWLLFSLCYARGNFREFLKRWRWILFAMFIGPVVIGLGLQDNLILSATEITTGHWLFSLGIPGLILNLSLLATAVLVLMNLERTFRDSVGTMRWRIKFAVLGIGALFAVRAYTCCQILLFHAIDPAWQTINAGALIAACTLISVSLFRSREVEADIYPSHSLLQNSLTALLAGVYLLVVGVFAKVVTFGGGDAAFALKAFVILAALIALAVLLLSERVRMLTSRWVSRHFQRPQYDYRRVWRKFAEGTAPCVNQNDLCQTAIKLTSELFQVLSVTIWLADEKKEKFVFAASTFLSESKANEFGLTAKDFSQIITAFKKQSEPADIDASTENWAGALRLCHPDEFRGGHRFCVPLIVADEILGLMILGDRVGSIPFSHQDFDLLKCVGDEIAARLLNVRLSQKLLQTKELEAFQTMSAFFVHDLKNAANTLNLMLQNLPVHFDDPEFRADALRGVQKTVDQIGRLIKRLTLLRNELQIKPAESDLNEVISKTLAGWNEISGVNLQKKFEPLPKISLDEEQIRKVITNLILNAKEAAPKHGEIRVETFRNNGSAVLSVSDNGCGMSPEFLNQSLFRPFQTTKKNGLGIGMFQSKMIVEAHRGRIEVESEPGKGTTFKIFFPVGGQSSTTS